GGVSEEGLRNRSSGTVRGEGGNGGADKRPRGKAAALPSALVVDEEKAEFVFHHRSAEAAAKNILLHGRTRQAFAIQEEVVGVEDVIAEEFIGVAVKFAGAGLQNGVDVAATVAALAGVIERSLHFELLDDVGIGERDVGGLRNVVIGGADALD